ncbi:MAG: diaminopimelate decarboxylase [Verrucomicrobia bacterium CG1_02_43_26]|nr:MAG: diaminopimelate decarboxylase [Verrucomicrobia bacterium CG1_02_43_26]
MVIFPFITDEVLMALKSEFETPLFVYSEAELMRNAKTMLDFHNPYGLTVRYAMKALPNAAILRLFDSMGIHIDASSGFEAERALLAGIKGEKISLSSQELPRNLSALLDSGILFNACSLRQLEAFGKIRPNHEVGVRFNPGLGSGGSRKTNVGGPSASFGIWYENWKDVAATAAKYGLKIVRIHTHIGSGAEAEAWQRAAEMSLDIVRQFPEVTILNLGGGFKVGRVPEEKSVDTRLISSAITQKLENFAEETGRQLHLEVEPGTYLVASGGVLITTIDDIVATGQEGYEFIKLNAGLTEIMRPALYGAHHPIMVLTDQLARAPFSYKKYVVVGHCCESGDLITCGETPETIASIELLEAKVGDTLAIGAVGAYCSAMCAKNYNSFPEAAEVLLREDGTPILIRKRQTLGQIIENEL